MCWVKPHLDLVRILEGKSSETRIWRDAKAPEFMDLKAKEIKEVLSNLQVADH